MVSFVIKGKEKFLIYITNVLIIRFVRSDDFNKSFPIKKKNNKKRALELK